MRFSLVGGPRQRADLGQTAAECWNQYVGDAVLADELGFDAAYVGEHHFCFASGNSSPLMMLTEVAAKTERIKVGTSIICAPFHNPLRLAEDIAALDIASNGRAEIGIGIGSQWEEFETFGIDPAERFGRTWETIDLIERCLSSSADETFDWSGAYYDYPGIRWIMQPVQERVPLLWGGFGPQGVTKAAKRGMHLLAPDVTGAYQRTLAEMGRDPRDYLIGFTNTISIADTKRQALDAMIEPCTWVSNQYALRKDLAGNQPPAEFGVTVEDMAEAFEAGLLGLNPPEPGMKSAPFIVPIAGTSDDIIEYFLPVVRGERGLITNLCISAREPGTSDEAVHRTLRRFAADVMPVLRAEAVSA